MCGEASNGGCGSVGVRCRWYGVVPIVLVAVVVVVMFSEAEEKNERLFRISGNP